MARVVARARLLDLDHLGAEIGERLRAPRPREHAGEIENAEAGEWGGHEILARSAQPVWVRHPGRAALCACAHAIGTQRKLCRSASIMCLGISFAEA